MSFRWESTLNVITHMQLSFGGCLDETLRSSTGHHSKVDEQTDLKREWREKRRKDDLDAWAVVYIV